MALRRQIGEGEKEQVLGDHGRVCFIDGAPIPEDEKPEFHHIQPFALGGPTDIANIAPVCKKHHLTLGTMSLQEYKDKLVLGRFFEDGAPKYLNDLITHRCQKCGQVVRFQCTDGTITLYDDGPAQVYPLHQCPTTKWRYFYATLPVCHLGNDTELQPRALREASVWSLYRNFLTNTQLAPSICRMLEDGTVLLFDGQHKAAAQIWAGRPKIECKVYLWPDARALKETNLEAHGQYRQMSFYSAELMRKYADVCKEDWEEYLQTEGAKSELGFFNFLVHAKSKSRAAARKEIWLAVCEAITGDPSARISEYMTEKQRGRRQPLSFSRVERAFLRTMVLDPPVGAEFETDEDHRADERRNLVRLLDIVVEEGLDNRWNPDVGNALHLRTERVFSAGAIRAWALVLRDTINQHLHHYSEDQRATFLFRSVSEEDFGYFKRFVARILAHKLWDDPDPTGEVSARLAKDDATTARTLFAERGLTVDYVLRG
jgi:hypothetical protein